jgi:hypothetical protein
MAWLIAEAVTAVNLYKILGGVILLRGVNNSDYSIIAQQ